MPQILVLILLFLNVGAAVISHGQKMKRNAFITGFDAVVTISLLYWGGFF